MSWTDLFKSSSTPTDADPRVRWFGKLPTYPDYYRSQTDEEWTVEFNTWILKGFELYQGRVLQGNHHAPRLPLSLCIVRLPKSGMTVFASVLDYGGDMRGRPFPICFYVAMPSHRWPGPTSDRIRAAADVMRRLLDLRREVARFLNSPGSFEADFARREIDLGGIEEDFLDTSWLREAGSISMSDWFEKARGVVKAPGRDEWTRLATQWGDNIARHEGKKFEPTLRFPLARGLPLDVQAAGWLCWLEARMDLGRRSLSLLMTADLEREAGSLSVIAREIIPDDFFLITSMTDGLSYVDDVSLVGAPDPEGQDDDAPAHGGVAEAIDDGGSWSEFVQATGTAP